MSDIMECVKCKRDIYKYTKIFVVNDENVEIYQCPYCGAYQVKGDG